MGTITIPKVVSETGQWCPVCHGPMKFLFTSSYCPKDCDKRPKNSAVKYEWKHLDYLCQVWTGAPPKSEVFCSYWWISSNVSEEVIKNEISREWGHLHTITNAESTAYDSGMYRGLWAVLVRKA